jgi:hypothetical protein
MKMSKRKQHVPSLPFTAEGVSIAASLMGHASVAARIKKWGIREYLRRQRKYGKLGGKYGRLGGRPRKDQSQKGESDGRLSS